MRDIIIFGGQSNMQGQTEALVKEPPVAGACEYLYATDSFRPLTNPVGEDFDPYILASAYGFGSMVPSFCRAYVGETGIETVAVHASKGATIISEWARGGERYAFALKKIKAAVAATRDVGKIYYVWLQGESDALAGTSESDYAAALTSYAAALKQDVGIDLFGIIKVGYFAKTVKGDAPADEVIMRAQEKTAVADGFAMLTDICPALSLDPAYLNPIAAGHYNNEGQRLIGETAGRKLGVIRKRG